MKKENLSAYEIKEERYIADLDSHATTLVHKKTGAKVAILENDDSNKVFFIGFRTPPKDSTGVAHILEHSVLCGSEKYPSKDPFVELAKGSLNTFLNAMTYPDKTVYPIASCNEQDFKNLTDVYLDAVFHPNIHNEKKIFMQEGWHYELDEKDGELKYNGVVYNEMKGAFSSADDVLAREIMNSLYPETAYGVESGGDPDVIPELKYEDFLEFHNTYYHPSNSYIFLYGDADMAERLDYIDREYLSKYDRITVDSFPGEQKGFDNTLYIEKEYPITEDEEIEDNTYLSYNVVLEKNIDIKEYIAFQIIDYALVDAQGTLLKKTLLDKGIGDDIYSFFENGIYQPSYSFVAKNANVEDKDEFIATIKDCLKTVVKDGFDENALLAGLNGLEFKYRESDFGSRPRGLFLGLNMLDSWLYDESRVFDLIECNETYKFLREQIGTGYYEKLVEKYLLDNTHSSVVVVKPVKGLTAKKDAALADKLASIKNEMSEAELEQVISDTKALLEYQETPDSEEVLRMIPRLKREDLEKKSKPFVNELINVNGTDILVHDIFTNGISYLGLMFDSEGVPAEYLPYLGLVQYVLGCVDTNKYSYENLGYEIDKQTGNLIFTATDYTNAYDDNKYKSYFVAKTKYFNNNANVVFSLLKEMLISSKLYDSKRIGEIISETKSRIESVFIPMGHVISHLRCTSYFSESAERAEIMSGLDFYGFICKAYDIFSSDDENAKKEFGDKFTELFKYLFRADKLFVDYIGDKEGLDNIKAELEAFKAALYKDEIVLSGSGTKAVKKNEGLTSSSTVNFVSRAGNFRKAGLDYTGALRVLKTILGYEYLWSEVRVKGGAYGCMSGFARSGNCYFVSYRDPNLDRTIETYEKAVEFIENFKADEDGMTKFIIGTMSDIDMPLTPRIKGERSFAAYISGITYEDVQRERDEILSATDEDIRALAAHIKAFLSENAMCVIGNEEMIRNANVEFGEIKSLIG